MNPISGNFSNTAIFGTHDILSDGRGIPADQVPQWAGEDSGQGNHLPGGPAAFPDLPIDLPPDFGKFHFDIRHDSGRDTCQMDPADRTRYTTTEKTTYPWGCGGPNWSVTHTDSIGHSTIKTERHSNNGIVKQPDADGPTEVTLSARDNYTVNYNEDGSVDITINGVPTHLTPEQASNMTITKVP